MSKTAVAESNSVTCYVVKHPGFSHLATSPKLKIDSNHVLVAKILKGFKDGDKVILTVILDKT